MSFGGIHVFERHSILIDSIGVFLEETEAFELVKLMLIIGYSLLVFLTICQVVLYYLYNGKYHPYCKIVMPNRKCKLESIMCNIAILDLNSELIEIVFHFSQLLPTNHRKNLHLILSLLPMLMKLIRLNLLTKVIPNLKK